jgi:uncharacterized protein (DUF1810 family)
VDEPPTAMLFSMEADLYPRNDPDKADEIEGSLGEGSQFQGTFGYYAQGVRPETVVGPLGWEDRLVEVEIPPRVGQAPGVVALCLEVHDLVLAKCAAGREQDFKFARYALEAELVEVDELWRRLETLPKPPADRLHIKRMLEGRIPGSARPDVLQRFLDAQDASGTYERALAELRAGRKTSHWMWFVFPQIAGLGESEMARRYAIGSLEEARAYVEHPVLGARLRACAGAVLGHSDRAAEEILGGIDAMKLRSSMTLFARAAPGEAVFGEVLVALYGGLRDPQTEKLIG